VTEISFSRVAVDSRSVGYWHANHGECQEKCRVARTRTHTEAELTETTPRDLEISPFVDDAAAVARYLR
jgi:hypothetical protein